MMRSARLGLIVLTLALVLAGTIMNVRNWHAEVDSKRTIRKAVSLRVPVELANSSGSSMPTPTFVKPLPSHSEPNQARDETAVDQPAAPGQSRAISPEALSSSKSSAATLRQSARDQQAIEAPILEPTQTPTATPTPRPTQTPTSTPSPTPTPTPQFVNGLSSDEFVVMDEQTRLHIREIYARGRTLGRNPSALSRIGASIIETDQFLVKFGTGDFDLGPYNQLLPVIDHFSQSFERYGVGVRRGLGASAVLDPAWSDKRQCQPNESMIACEFRLNNPSVLILVLGTNDIGSAELFERNMRQIVEFSLDEGVIPILATKADRYEGRRNRNNDLLRQIAAVYQVPLWDYDNAASTLPNRGLGSDGVHMTFVSEFDYNQPTTLQRGYGLYNLTVLMVLDDVWREMKLANALLSSSSLQE